MDFWRGSLVVAVPWLEIERQVLATLNALAGNQESERETIYTQTSALLSTQIGDEAFYRAKVRDMVVEAHQQTIRFICLTDGHPRRVLYRQTASVAHLASLPSSMGPYGDFTATVGGSPLKLKPHQSPNEVDEILRDAGALHGVTVGYYAIDGNVLHATQSPVTVEYYEYPRPVTDPSQLGNLFDSLLDVCAVPDEFVQVVVQVACGLLSLTPASGREDVASAHFTMATQLLRELGINVTPNDFYQQNGTAQ